MTNSSTRKFLASSYNEYSRTQSNHRSKNTSGKRLAKKYKPTAIQMDRNKTKSFRKKALTKSRITKIEKAQHYTRKEYGPWKQHIEVLSCFDDPIMYGCEISKTDGWIYDTCAPLEISWKKHIYDTIINLQYATPHMFNTHIDTILWNKYMDFKYEYMNEYYNNDYDQDNDDHDESTQSRYQHHIYEEPGKGTTNEISRKCPNCGYTL